MKFIDEKNKMVNKESLFSSIKYNDNVLLQYLQKTLNTNES